MARYVTVASVSESPQQTSRENPGPLLNHAAHLVWRAKKFGADIVSFPEIYPQVGQGKPAECAEELDGPTISRMRDEAKRNGLYVIWPLYRRDGDLIRNSSILIDRSGEIAGIYDKKHPTIGEIEDGVAPGDGAPTFETDFGRIGMAICFDLNFRDIMTGLADNGAEIIFFGSAYRGGLQLEAWALELGVYIVSSILAELGRIVDLTGKTLEMSTYETLISRRINLDRVLLHMDYNWGKMDAMLEKYGTDLRFDYITPEACYAIGAEREGLSIDDVLDEFELERRRDYFARANAVREQALDKAGLE